MIDLPTVIALLAPAVVLFVFDQVIRRVFARRRPRTDAGNVPAPEALGPTGLPITPAQSAQAAERAADARRVA